MFDRHQGGERAVLVNVVLAPPAPAGDPAEFAELAASAGVLCVATLAARRDRPDPKHFIGDGKAEELRALVTDVAADVVLFDHALSPAQERNLERLIGCRVLDRTGVILDIFAQRARSFEGQLQVEMAQLRHLSTRLVRGWTHLERQRGGIGLRGPGETQLETDRRLIGNRIKQLNEKLERLRRQRQQSARARRRASLHTAALVGYTNAGKSTLFNRLTSSETYAADQLFATLDTTLRRMNVPGEHPVLLSDTVGFIRDLPPDLVAAFHATLDETKDATLLLHVIDASADDMDAKREEVVAVLERIGARDTPVLEVYNKIDRCTDVEPRIERDELGTPIAVWVSAHSGAGLDLLRAAIAERLDLEKLARRIMLAPTDGRLRAQLYEMGAVLHEKPLDEGGWRLDITLSPGRWGRLFPQRPLPAPVPADEYAPDAAATTQEPRADA
ncbi:MAG: GTPase HflX [Gammaproteobacteria bacterium]|nr:GTPase HflX [Gammaproteobacteria bacterium]